MSALPTISDAAPLIQSGRLHPRELVDRCLARIQAYEDRLHAWVRVDDAGARREAETLGREAAAGNCRGPLHGIPLGIKDIIDVAGMSTRAGSPLRANHRATADAPLVAALRRAGAIILGKTVTVEFACFDPSPTRNPWDPALQHTPGGSSSGSAVAVAMGMCLGGAGHADRRLAGAALDVLRHRHVQAQLRPALAGRHRTGQLPPGSSRPDGPIGGRPGDHAPRPVGRKGDKHLARRRFPGVCVNRFGAGPLFFAVGRN